MNGPPKKFVAIDGEGINSGGEETIDLNGHIYRSRDHHYTYVAAGTGDYLFDSGKRLSTNAMIDWLLNLGAASPDAIFVMFAGGYDCNHILRDYTYELVEEIYSGSPIMIEHGGETIEIQYRPRKSMTLKRGLTEYIKDNGKRVRKWCDKIIIWDSFGFFQDSFIGVMKKWLGETHPDYALVKKMKGLRGNFEHIAQREIDEYNKAELRCLEQVMELLREATENIGLKLTRWDGAGAVASAMFRENKIKDAKGVSPVEVLQAARHAFAGGRIETCKVGTWNNEVWDYDINSAYPAAMVDLPALNSGSWAHGEGWPKEGSFSLVHLKYDFDPGQRFYPLFYRTKHKTVLFPQQGEGWYWLCEAEAAKICPGSLEAVEHYTWVPTDDIKHWKPFHFVHRYFETRAQWVDHPTEHWHRGGEKILKLGYNSLYGKTAQSIGGRMGEPPPYHQIEWAGWITAATRARLYLAAMNDPDAIMGFATDGIFSQVDLGLTVLKTKTLGSWSLQKFTGLTLAMAGVYWLHRADGSFANFSRGFDKADVDTPEKIWAAWKRGEEKMPFQVQRLLGMGAALKSQRFWDWRARFVLADRQLTLDGDNAKRIGINVRGASLHRNMVDLVCVPNRGYLEGLEIMSRIYEPKFLKNNESADELEMLEGDA